MDADDLMLDGNAMGGVLGEVFLHEMTSARVACSGCGATEPLGAELAYVQAPGPVLRCRHCEGVMLVVTQRGGRYLLGFQQLQWIEITDNP
jgi:hypothetical protein